MSKSEVDETEVKQELVDYVIVAETDDGEQIELPTLPEDGSLGFSTLTHAFPGAHGLKYKTANGVSRALLIDPSGTRFFPPADGWKGKTFFVIYSQSRGPGDQNTKRKKMMDESDDGSSADDIQGGAKQKRLEEPPEKTSTDLIVLGIPFKTTSETARAYFETFGEVVMFDLKTDVAGNSKGFGFVRMKDYDAQLRVLAKPIHEIDGRRCQVRIPLSKGEANFPLVARIFVGRVPEKMTTEDLKSFFNNEAAKIDPSATVTDVFIPRPFRSFAFVNFSSGVVAKEIIRGGDYIINGSSVAVSAAAPREPDYSPRVPQKIMYGRNRSNASFSRKHHAPFETFPPDSQSMYYDNFDASDNWRVGAYRGSDNRGSNRFSPGYSSTSRYGSNARSGTSQALASGLDALNLNKMNVNPEVMDAAWQAFWSTLNNNGGGSSSSNPSSKW